MRKLPLFLCLLPPPACFLLYAATDFTAEGKRWWSHIEYLASDDLKGRDTGSEGHLKAARYVAGEFERSGLKPAGTSGYFQPVKFDVKQIVEEQSSLALIRDGKVEPLVLGDDASLGLRGDNLASMLLARAGDKRKEPLSGLLSERDEGCSSGNC